MYRSIRNYYRSVGKDGLLNASGQGIVVQEEVDNESKEDYDQEDD